MSMLTRIVACMLVVAPVSQVCGASDEKSVIAIVGAAVLHPERDGPQAISPDTTVIVADGRIRAVGSAKSTPVPQGATVIDGRGKWISPGLIDSHVHFIQSGNLYTRPDIADFSKWMPYAKEDARNRARLPATFKVWLASGVTSVADVGGAFWDFHARDAARASEAAPRVAVAGPLLSTVARPALDLGDPPIIKVESPAQARELVTRELAHKPDYIKFLFAHRPDDDLAAQAAIVEAAAEAAHAAGVRLAVHAMELATAKAALRAGADILVHSVFDVPVDAEFIGLARANHVLYCPTLFVMTSYEYAFAGLWEPSAAERRFGDPQVLASMNDLTRIPANLLPPDVAAAMRQHETPKLPTAGMENLRRVWDAGITVVMGTDAGNIGVLHGPSVFREMQLMAQSGLTPLQVLRAATVNGARMIGMPAQLGTIEPGKLADLVILDADPLADIGNVSRISRVIKGGVVFDPERLIASIR